MASPVANPCPPEGSPVTTSPVFTPMRTSRLTPQRRSSSSFSVPRDPAISTEARMARNASSSCTTGMPNTAMTASPMNFSTVPPCRSRTRRVVRKKRDTTWRTVSGSRRSPSSVEPAMSAKTTVTVLRALRSNSGAAASGLPQAEQKRASFGPNLPHTPHTAMARSLNRRSKTGRAKTAQSGLSLDIRHDVLDPGVVLEPVQAEVLAVAGVLETAVGHLGDQGDVGVDPDAAEVEGAGHAHGAAVVAGPDAGGEAVLDAVGPGEGLLLVVEALDGDDRAEDLLLDHLVVLLEAVDDGRLVEEAAAVQLAAAGGDLGVAGGAVQEALDPGQLVGVLGGAGGGALGLLDQGGKELVVDPASGEDAGGGGAVLAGVEVAGGGDHLGRGGHVGVVEDDHRGLAAQLQVDPLEVVGGRLGHLLAGANAAGDRDHGRGLVRDQPGPGLAVADDHVHDAVGQELAHQLGHPHGGDRGGVARLEDDRVAGRERRGELPDGHHERVVPGGDLGADPDRLAPDHRGVPGHVLAGGQPVEHARGAGEEADLVDRRRHLLVHGELERLAGVLALQPDQFLGPVLEGVGDLQQGPAALGGGGVAPLLEAALGRLHGRVDVGLARSRDLGELLAGGGVDQGGGAPVGRVPVPAPDEVLQRAKRHCLLLARPARSGRSAVGHARWRRASSALPTAMATPPRKISVPITLTWGGTPIRVAPYTQIGKVSTWPLTKLVTT